MSDFDTLLQTPLDHMTATSSAITSTTAPTTAAAAGATLSPHPLTPDDMAVYDNVSSLHLLEDHQADQIGLSVADAVVDVDDDADADMDVDAVLDAIATASPPPSPLTTTTTATTNADAIIHAVDAVVEDDENVLQCLERFMGLESLDQMQCLCGGEKTKQMMLLQLLMLLLIVTLLMRRRRRMKWMMRECVFWMV